MTYARRAMPNGWHCTASAISLKGVTEMPKTGKDQLRRELAEFIEKNYIGLPLLPTLETEDDLEFRNVLYEPLCPPDEPMGFAAPRPSHPKAKASIAHRFDAAPQIGEDGELPFGEETEDNRPFEDIFKLPRMDELKKPTESPTEEELKDFLKATDISESFTEYLLRTIQEKNLTEAEVYNSVFMDRRLFNKIRNDIHYQPTKRTALLLSVALKLDLKQTQEFIGLAGFKMTHASKTDLIVEFFIRKRRYDIIEINEMLEEYHMPLLLKCE